VTNYFVPCFVGFQAICHSEHQAILFLEREINCFLTLDTHYRYLSMNCWRLRTRVSSGLTVGKLHSRVYGMRQRKRRRFCSVFLNWWRSFAGTNTTSSALNPEAFSPSKSWPSPSSMKTSCSHGCVCNGLCPPGSISKRRMAKFWAPSSLVMSQRTFVFRQQSPASWAFTVS
jgi:hypothetical protein